MKKLVMVGGVIAAMFLMCDGPAVRADDESDRKSLITNINDLLRETSDYLRSASSSSGPSEVDQARDRAGRVRDKLSSLDRVKGDDDTAKRYVERFPRFLEDFERAASTLRALKVDQRSIAELPRRCQDLDRQLTEQAAQFERDKDGGRIEELRRLALDAGGKAEDWWRDADKQRDQQQRRNDDARRFGVTDTDDWSRVTSSLQDTAQRSLETWMKDFQEVERACKDLRQRDRHPAVEQALRSLAGTANGKDQIYQQFDDKLKRAESVFKDLFDAGDSGKAGDARTAIDEIDRLVRDLDSIKGNDKKANQIAASWPDIIKAFAPAQLALVGLKDAERELDDVPYRCSVAARELQDKMDGYASNRDPDGLHVVPAEAEKLGERYTRALSAVDATKSTREQLVRQVTAFDPRDDRWRSLRGQMKDTAERLFAYWDQHRETAHKACDDLAKGVRNPAVEKFMQALGANAQSDLKDFQDVVAVWERDAREIYMLDCKQMQELWDAWCEIEFEPNEAPDDSVLLQHTTSLIETQLAKISGVLARLPALRATAANLLTKNKYRSTIEKLQRDVFDKQEPRLQKLLRQDGDWRGTNNPATVFATNYGKQAHDRLNSAKSCDVYDQEGYPDIGRDRPDCVKVEGNGQCYVYEFKPKGWKGKDKVPDYVGAVQRYYTARMRDGSSPASNLGGAGFQALVESNCRSDPSKDKKTDVVTFLGRYQEYERCEQKYECVRE